MSERANAILDAAVPTAKRRALPDVLSKALQRVSNELRACGFDPGTLEPAKWHWDWNPELDGEFEAWLEGPLIDIFWPDSAGLGVQCSAGAVRILTGVRWRLVKQSEVLRGQVVAIVGAVGAALGARSCLLLPDTVDVGAVRAQDIFFGGGAFPEMRAALMTEPNSDYLDCTNAPAHRA